MQFSIQEYAFLFITILFGVLFGLFVWQTTKRRRTATALVISLLFGFLACISAIFSTGTIIALTSLEIKILEALQLNLFGVQFFFFFIFFERLRSKDLHAGRFSLMISLLLVQTISLWLRIYFISQGVLTGVIDETLWFLQDMGYAIAGILVYLVFNLIIYLKTYNYTKEIKPLIISIALGLVGVGFIFSFFKDLFDFFSVTVDWIGIGAEYTMPVQALGLFIFTCIYLSDIDYLYRLPNDIFLLMVSTTAGIPLHTVKLKTHREGRIEEDLLSGMLSAVNNVFSEVFKEESLIRNISSEGISVLMEPGKKKQIVALVITDKISYFLIKALKRYAKAFEKHFSNELADRIQNTTSYSSAIELIKPIFPFFIIKTDQKV